MSSEILSLDDDQLGRLKKLVETPSFCSVEAPGSSEDAILQYIESEVSKMTGCTILENDHILIVEKENGDAFTALLYVHVDTVWGRSDTLKMRKKGDKVHGLGIRDMKGGVLIAMEVLEKIRLPKGMRLIVVFSRDEEKNSSGAKRLLAWPGLKKVDIGLSPEIATSRENAKKDSTLIYGRGGNLKTAGIITVPGTHGGIEGGSGAAREFRKAMEFMEQTLSEKQRDDRSYRLEGLEETGLIVPSHEYLRKTPEISFSVTHMLGPDSTLERALAFQQECFKKIEEVRGWAKQNIAYVLDQDRSSSRTSYESYSTDRDHPFKLATEEAVRDQYGEVEIVFDGGTADGNLIVPEFLRKFDRPLSWLEKPYIGGGEHTEGVHEWASISSIAKNLAFHMHLITKGLAPFIDKAETKT